MVASDKMELFDRVNTISRCLMTVSNLVVPEKDFTVVSRNDFSILLGFLIEEQNTALAKLDQRLANP